MSFSTPGVASPFTFTSKSLAKWYLRMRDVSFELLKNCRHWRTCHGVAQQGQGTPW
ncbi:hypothetical protein L208DRAFT_1406955 [Tricholoma matsutake]|nr:hypothetical protein L208DRAFT_1406955 [Tricholoma matsutake 945]